MTARFDGGRQFVDRRLFVGHEALQATGTHHGVEHRQAVKVARQKIADDKAHVGRGMHQIGVGDLVFGVIDADVLLDIVGVHKQQAVACAAADVQHIALRRGERQQQFEAALFHMP